MKILEWIAAAILPLVLFTGVVFADYTISPPSGGEKSVAPVLTQEVKYQGAVTASKHPADNTEPSKPDSEDEEKEDIQPALEGMVSHTQDWEKNRSQFNTYCRESGNLQWERASDVYWSGEKFVLSAATTGKKQPSSVRVKIQDTSYEASLRREGGLWEGELFDRSMIDRWGKDGSESLYFVFSAVIDGRHCEDIQLVTVEDIHKYWQMHRKE